MKEEAGRLALFIAVFSAAAELVRFASRRFFTRRGAHASRSANESLPRRAGSECQPLAATR